MSVNDMDSGQQDTIKSNTMEMQTGTFVSFDKKPLFYRRWHNEETNNGKILLLLHRGHEHSLRLQSIANNKAFHGYTIYSFDNRGHGMTDLPATFEFMDLVRDLDAFAHFVCIQENKQQKDIFVVANSVAGVVASTWVHDYAPSINGMALVAPAFKIKLYIPFAKPALTQAVKLLPRLNITSYVKSKYLTHDKSEQQKYDSDDLITPHIPARQLTTLLETGERIVNDAAMITVPTLVLSAGKDYVVDSKVQGDFYARLSSENKRFVLLEHFFHGVLYEENAQTAIDEIAQFAEQSFTLSQPCQRQQLIKIAQQECDQISYGTLPLLSNANFLLQRTSMKYLGFLSKGMKIGLQYGFDSGVTLDHVYKNEPQGAGAIGRFIDKGYLNSIGWKGIRQRKKHTIKLLEEKIQALQAEGQKVNILDIAGGPARYLIEIANQYRDVNIQVRDYQIQNVEQGRALAKERGLENISYSQCDAFDLDNYERDEFSPNIVVISGVFELFPDNELISKAIKGLCSIINANTQLIYTGQPWHPQLHQIANVLGNHQQSKWIMRRRSQYELDNIFAHFGFKKDNMLIDDWGIFTVSAATFTPKSAEPLNVDITAINKNESVA
ncbi:bifunctional alpha/beta hydrolase/class I SAM-dependent methyltransferase [Psychromonas sp. Urea-02u-13]|uniref:bifunctional alpha/beta hydrolase/class I SAM-dependent methyltransferase n=1 Tax=Psychromonas sp. Urea-02u-13 TaxID=2058326 RepID=UPI0018E3DA6A|nr:bifunctional alpha/beta hydrolase/class I SAM-dependent methyltransferase [Psychromonas sp. Urea-02u-13]